jgi:prepilin-type N-terminal cleavage/methylation domain-containing protein
MKTQKAFTLLELLITTSVTALLMLAVSSLFITFLATAYKSRISQNLRQSGGNATRQIIDMLRSANEVTSPCESASPLDYVTLIGNDGLETTIREEDDRIASISANGKFYLTESSDLSEDYVQDLFFTCYPTEEGKKYIEVDFNLRVGTGEAENSPRATQLDFGSGVATRN